MEVKTAPMFVLLACFWLADCCNRSPTNICTDNTECSQDVSEHSEKPRESQRITRSAERGARYNIMLEENPCSFNTYDMDQNEEITMKELRATLGNNKVTDGLFEELDIVRDDGAITPDEFDEVALRIINECFDSNK